MNFGNLIRSVDRGESKRGWAKKFEADVAEVRELLDFFADQPRADREPYPPRIAPSDQERLSWAHAFEAAGLGKIAPDTRGRWRMLSREGLVRGVLREPLNSLVYYFKRAGFEPADWGTKIDDTWCVPWVASRTQFGVSRRTRKAKS